MTTKNNERPPGQLHGSTRIRATIYGARRPFALRMTPELNARLMAHCNSVPTAANTYIVGLIESALSAATPASQSLKRVKSGRINVSLRMTQELHDRLMAFCAAAPVSANALIRGLIQKDLNKQGV